MSRRLVWLPALFPALLAADSCRDCHSALEGPLGAPAAAFARDVHAHRGFGCADCHGGDPAQDDPALSMSRARGFLGKISRLQVPRLCARCHSDARLIHKFRPQQRVDQFSQYLTSVHGKRWAAGDAAAANCVDCHGVHGIREVRDAESPVHPLKLPATCARCHADAAYMARYRLPTNQFEEYRQSVHWEALAKRRDPSAPSCASCHGNHGATPPQVSSVAAVCGSCHALLEDLYRQSPHQPVFAALGRGGCSVCHDHHRVRRPSVELLAGPRSVCVQCHQAGSPGAAAAAEMARLIRSLNTELDRSDAILAQAARDGMEVSEAQARQQEGREALVKARVAVHTARLAEVAARAREGLAIAAQTYRAGQDALRERDFRRWGLAVSLAAIALTLAGLWLRIRALERPPAGRP